MHTPTDATFLNVDLELYSDVSIERVLREFGEEVLVHRNGVEHAQNVVWLQLAAGPRPDDLDGVVERFNQLVSELTPQGRACWDACTDRAFNLGVQSGLFPHLLELRLSTMSLAHAADIGVRLVVSVYAFSQANS